MNLGLPGMGAGSVTMQVSGMSGQESVEETVTVTSTVMEPGDEPAPVVGTSPSKLSFMSEQGMCTVYLDGSQRLELPLSGIDEMAKDSIFDLKPGSYQIKVEGFETWYEGVLQVGPGEEVKIRVEPQQFTIIGRNPL